MKFITWITIMFVLLVFAGFIYFSGASLNQSGSASVDSSGAQKVVLSMQNGNYWPRTITVKAGQKVSLELDNSIQGCYRSFNIRDLGVSGYSASPSQTIDFVPQQKGSFRFACGMGMGYGTIIVD